MWDKNDLFQGEKFGMKFETLEIEEFLNESGFNENDVEFLQKFENTNPPQQSLKSLNMPGIAQNNNTIATNPSLSLSLNMSSPIILNNANNISFPHPLLQSSQSLVNQQMSRSKTQQVQTSLAYKSEGNLKIE